MGRRGAGQGAGSRQWPGQKGAPEAEGAPGGPCKAMGREGLRLRKGSQGDEVIRIKTEIS